jgi:hypothetical protein
MGNVATGLHEGITCFVLNQAQFVGFEAVIATHEFESWIYQFKERLLDGDDVSGLQICRERNS